MKKKVLFIDDDIDLGNIVQLGLKTFGYEGYYLSSLAGITAVINDIQPDSIILDLDVNGHNSIEVLPSIKLSTPNIPILFISSHIEAINTVQVLKAGGLAFIKKTFEIRELLAYINRFITSKNKSLTNSVIQFGSSDLDIERRILRVKGTVIKRLSNMEFNLLSFLLQRQNDIATRDELNKKLFVDGNISDASLNNYIFHLRKYLEGDDRVLLQTISHQGYQLKISSKKTSNT